MKPNAVQSGEPLSDTQKWVVAGVCVIAALAMRYVGLLAMWPRDPDLPVSLLTCRYPGLVTIEMAALAAAASALVVAVLGKRLAGVGVLAVGAGLLAIGWGDGDWRLLVAYIQQFSPSWTVANLRLASESLGWAAVIIAALIAERVVREWLGLSPRDEGSNRVAAMYSRTSVFFRMVLTSYDQWLMMAAAGLTGVVLIEVLYADNVGAQLGQGFFIAAVAMMGGTLLAQQIFPVKTVWPAALAWLVPALAGHVWAIMSPDRAGTFMQTGINPLADLLPIQYAAGGTIGGIIGLWLSHSVTRWRNEQQAAE